MKINPTLHGVLDYLVVIFLAASPALFQLPEMTAKFTYMLAGIHLLLTVCTDFKPGLIRIIPFRMHGMVEVVVSVALLCMAFYFGGKESVVARNFYIGVAAAVAFVWLLTDYKGEE